jgi:hydroxymethylpyrimidine pyrophosphatase-like HAD family hydrolase
LPQGRKFIIAIDIDGTIADCSGVDYSKVDENPNELMKARPKKEALVAVRRLYRQGHKIVFYSSRDHRSLRVTKKWLKESGFPFHDIRLGKFVAHVYIDDRAINGQNWKRALLEIGRFRRRRMQMERKRSR